MQGMRRLALTGTPATGKSSVCALLDSGDFDILTVRGLAVENDCIGEVDASDDARPIDLEMLSEALEELWIGPPEKMTIIDGHLSHLLPVDGVVLLRCRPDILRGRLDERGYHNTKSESNVEWEFIGGAWNEYDSSVPWTEFDTSENSAGSIVQLMRTWISDGFKPKTPDSGIDWIEQGAV
ncbi:MAG TPA: AAA family ATPase [Candidatus Thalassarchaeaceae archaeon]|jgi:adenylate kinase|nr:AAA family ATPase [Candidatus Thalassarchaeaceae archaeon]|tara:strand:+ start:1585 stop:2127 length:543 start_codon:yes stop_codon:yes gene_type:complete